MYAALDRAWTTEEDFRMSIVALLRQYGYQEYHVEYPVGTRKGFPDLTVWGNGRVFFRELKTDRGQLTREQRFTLLKLRQSGADVDVWRPRDRKRIIDDISGEDVFQRRIQ